MANPPCCIYFPAYVVAYAEIDSSVRFTNRRNVNVGGNWLGAVPRLAICRNWETEEFQLAHCDEEWSALCAVEAAGDIEAVKAIAEKHYEGIGRKWIETHYTEGEARALYQTAQDETRCSFCGRSQYDREPKEMIEGTNARICDICIRAFYVELGDEHS